MSEDKPEVKPGQVWERKEGALRLIVQHVGEIYVTVTDPDDKGASIRREALLDHYRLVWPDAPTDAELATRWYEADGTWITLPRAEVIERRKAAAAELARLRADALTRGERAELLAWRRVDTITSSGKLYTHKMIHWLEEARRLRAENEAARGVMPNARRDSGSIHGRDAVTGAAHPNNAENEAARGVGDEAASGQAGSGDVPSRDRDAGTDLQGTRVPGSTASPIIQAATPALPAGRAAAEPEWRIGLHIGTDAKTGEQAYRIVLAPGGVMPKVGDEAAAITGWNPFKRIEDARRAVAAVNAGAAADAPDMVAVRREDVLDAARCARGMLMLALEGRLRAAAERAADGPR